MNPQLVTTSRLARLSLRVQGDARLAEMAGAGSEAAFEAIVHRYRPALVRHCARVLGDADADEAVQETLLKAHRALAAGATVHSLGAWLHAIAHNSALALLAGRRVGAEYREDDASLGDASEQIRREHLDALVRALSSLPARQRQALVMRELEGRSYDEIAARLGASNGAVRQLLNRARASIRERLGALVPVELITRWITTASSAPSRALTFAGSGALAAKVSGAILLSAAPVVAVPAVPSMNSARSPARHEARPAARTVRVSPSAPGRGEPAAAVGAEVDREPRRDEHPLDAGHVVSGSPGPNCVISASRASRRGARRVSPPAARGPSPKPDEAPSAAGWDDRTDRLTDGQETTDP